MKDEDKLYSIIYLIIIVAVVGSYLGWSADTTNQVIQWLVSIFISILLTMVVASLVKAVTGNLLKRVKFKIKILGFSVYISLFTIVTFILKIWWFGL